MNERLKLYQDFIDGLTQKRQGVLSQWVTGKGWPKLPENKEYNKLLDKLSPEEKTSLAEMMHQSREAGIHAILVFLSEQMNLNGLRLFKNETELASEPYGTELFWDWTARCENAEWPGSDLAEEYK